MMLPLLELKGQPNRMVTTTTPWLAVGSEPTPHWLWLASCSTATYQATPSLFFYPRAVWIPDHTHMMQWEHPAVDVVPVLPCFYHPSHLQGAHPLPKVAEGWISPEKVGNLRRRDKQFFLTNRIISSPGVHTPPTAVLLSSRLSAGGTIKTRPYSQRGKGAWPLKMTNQWRRTALFKPVISLDSSQSPATQQFLLEHVFSSQLYMDKWPVLPVQMVKEAHRSYFSSRLSSLFTLLNNYRYSKIWSQTLTFSLSKDTHVSQAAVRVSRTQEEEEKEEGEGSKDQRPVASRPVPGSPWCVVWTGDDRIFFFNPTIHLSVWERPGDLIGRDISHIIEDPPHKRKKTPAEGQLTVRCGNHDNHEGMFKRNRTDEPMSLVPRPGDKKLLPLELRVAHFREMMLERGVSAFSTWDKELHKMVFDPRYLLLTPVQRKQVFDQFVKSRVKDEYKEKKTKLHKARADFRQLMEEANISSRSTFKDFSARYRGDQRFSILNRKKEQEDLFQHYITSLKKRDKENRVRLRKMR
ncbi:uncharacterized protein V6R79_021970 [Siganus canaliculatus]